jgi:uncharacterized protein (TIGR03663 family)
MRLVPVIAGLVTVGLILPLRRWLGSFTALTAALLLAVSPGAVYFSRYFIHEALLVCCSLGLVVTLLFYIESRRTAWLVATAVFAALIFTTKETGLITIGVLAIAAVMADRYVAARHPASVVAPSRGRRGQAMPGTTRPNRSIWVDGVEYRPADGGPCGSGRGVGGLGIGDRLARWSWPAPSQLAIAAVVFLVIWVLLFSSFFTNFPDGLRDSLATFAIWTQTGAATQIQPPQKYLEWMLQADAPFLALGAAGGFLVAYRATDRLRAFIGLWALGITLAYSLIQYKTPWIALNMIVPLALLAGVLIQDLWARAARGVVPLLLGAGVLVSGYQAVDLNYVHYDDETYGYVFVHTTRQATDLVREIEARSSQAGSGRETGIVIVSPDYWPLPWYLRDYKRAGFFGRIVPTEEPIVVAKVDQEAQLGAAFAATYARQAQYRLRPGVDLVLYLRRSTFGL